MTTSIISIITMGGKVFIILSATLLVSVGIQRFNDYKPNSNRRRGGERNEGNFSSQGNKRGIRLQD